VIHQTLPQRMRVDYSTSESHESSRTRHQRCRSERQSKRRSKHRSRKHSRTRKSSTGGIKPIPPKDYDGAADSRAYHQFVMEGQAYLRDGKVRRDERQIRILAHHLDGKAYDFYMQKVAPDDPKLWNLHRFFTELFNYCFPIDYRQQMRIKLDELRQRHNQPVSEFVHEIQELFNMVGAMPSDMKVIKLWYSLSVHIQRGLWRDGLHPDTSTWDEVVTKAEMIEITDSVLVRRERKPNRLHVSESGFNNFSTSYRQSHMASGSSSRPSSYAGNDRNHRSNQRHDGRGNNSTPSGNHSRHRSTQSTMNWFQHRNTTPRSHAPSSSNAAKRKTTKFTELTEKEMAQLRADGKCFNRAHVTKLP